MTRILAGFILISTFYCVSCNSTSSKKTNEIKDTTTNKKTVETDLYLLDRNTILKIAENDAKSVYKDLSIYKVKTTLRKDLWYVDYELSNPQMLGGGPHYVISAKTGKILSYRYEQ